MRRYTCEDYEAYRKRIGREGGQEAEEHQERTQSQSLRHAWLADGGSETDFEKAWPALRDEGRRQRVVDADRRTREEMRAHGPSRI
ncbi:MAG TPA: hypothetical protein VI055_15570 [Rubrobacter sp.]|jgi:hypothetical protein